MTMCATPPYSLSRNQIGKGGTKGAIALAEALAKMTNLTSVK